MNKEEQPLNILHASMSDTGLQRKENQDAYGKYPDNSLDLAYTKGQLFIVADGMGGHAGGSEASQLAVQVVLDYYPKADFPPPLRLKRAVQAANKAIYERVQASNEIVRMGTTCVVMLMMEYVGYIANVGDSRVYRIREEGIEQLTEDHSRVAEMYRQGILTKEEAENHPSKSVLSRALGMEPEVEVDMVEVKPLKPGDNFLLCTDGLGRVKPEDIRSAVLANEPQRACESLIGLANQTGGHDNITVQLIRVQGAENEKKVTTFSRNSLFRKVPRRAVGAIVITVLLAVGMITYSLLDKPKLDISRSSGIDVTPKNLSSPSAGRTDNTSPTLVNSAERLIQAEAYDSALAIYQKILRNNPMHLGAVRGIQFVSEIFKEQGDHYRDLREYNEAITYYKKAAALQPANQEVKRLLVLTERRANGHFTATGETKPANRFAGVTAKPETTPAAESEVPKDGATKTGTGLTHITSEKWRFPDLSGADYMLNAGGVQFTGTPSEKLAIYQQSLMDVDVEVDADLSEADSVFQGSYGIIVGYEGAKKRQISYYAFTVEENNHFKLKYIQNDRESVLLEYQQTAVATDSTVAHHLKVKCLGPWIMMYYNQHLLKAWLGNDIITGNVGLFAGKDTQVEFTHFRVSSALTIEQQDHPDQSETLQE